MAQLIWSPKSLHELKEIFEYIAVDSPEYGNIFIKEIIKTAILIPEFPISGRIVPEFKKKEIRERLYKNYRIIYRLHQDAIEIVTIFHNARQLHKKDL